jgi:hypothetical protein
METDDLRSNLRGSVSGCSRSRVRLARIGAVGSLNDIHCPVHRGRATRDLKLVALQERLHARCDPLNAGPLIESIRVRSVTRPRPTA